MVLTCMWTTPSGDPLFNDHPFGTFDAGNGRRPPHQSRSGGASSLECVGAGLGVRWHRRPADQAGAGLAVNQT